MDATVPYFLEPDKLATIYDLIADNGVGQLGDKVHECLGLLDYEGNMSGPAARGNGQWIKLGQAQTLETNAVYMNQICSQIRYKNESFGRINDCSMGMRCLLS
jgi:hypothetical protein